MTFSVLQYWIGTKISAQKRIFTALGKIVLRKLGTRRPVKELDETLEQVIKSNSNRRSFLLPSYDYHHSR